MEKLIIFVVSAIIIAEAYPKPTIEVYEIRKTKDRNFGVSDQYYDPDGLRDEADSETNTDNVASDLVTKLIHLLHMKRHSGPKTDYESDRDFTRSVALLIVPRADHEPQTALGTLLHSSLRSQYQAVEDRTAPPRVRRPYDDDY